MVKISTGSGFIKTGVFYAPLEEKSIVHSTQSLGLLSDIQTRQDTFVFFLKGWYNEHMRNYRELKAFQMADELVFMIYKATKTFPKDELFGLTSQLRRAAVSIPSNIVEGACRDTEAEFLRFLDMAYGSASELDYLISLAYRLGYLEESIYSPLREKSTETAKILNGLIRSLRKKPMDLRL